MENCCDAPRKIVRAGAPKNMVFAVRWRGSRVLSWPLGQYANKQDDRGDEHR